MLKVSAPTCVIGKFRIVHDLEKYVEDVLVCLFYFIKEKHAKGMLSYGLCQKASLVKAHVSRWGTY